MAIFKNETIDLKEWIEHYIWQGASHIYLADNESTDDPLAILQPYIDINYVTYIPMVGRNIQIEVYRILTKLIQELTNPPDWICIADLDEFWFGQEKPMNEVLTDYPESVHVVSRAWRVFGPSKDGFHPPSLRKHLVYRKPVESSHKVCFRTLNIQPKDVFIHHIANVSDDNHCIEQTTLQLHHYYCRSMEYWKTIKIPRGNVMGDNVYMLDDLWINGSSDCTVLDTNLADRIHE